MINSIALPIHPNSEVGTTARAFRPTSRYGWREISFYRLYSSTLEWLIHEAQRSQFIFPDEQYWTDPLFFPEEWPPHAIEEFLRNPYTQTALFE